MTEEKKEVKPAVWLAGGAVSSGKYGQCVCGEPADYFCRSCGLAICDEHGERYGHRERMRLCLECSAFEKALMGIEIENEKVAVFQQLRTGAEQNKADTRCSFCQKKADAVCVLCDVHVCKEHSERHLNMTLCIYCVALCETIGMPLDEEEFARMAGVKK